MRAGSAPMPRTPRLPGVRISKSRSFSSAPNASRAWRRASSTVLPVNSRYSLISASSPSSALTAPLAGADRRFGRGLLRGVGQYRRSLAWGGGRGEGNGESGSGPGGEAGRPAEDREHPAPAHDEVLLHDGVDRGRYPVDEEAGRQEPAVRDRDQRQEQHRLPLALVVRIVILGPRHRQHHPRLDELEQSRHDREDADAEDEAADRDAEQGRRLADVDAAEPRDDGVDARLVGVDHPVDDVGARQWHDLPAED